MLCGFSGLVRIRYFRVVWAASVLAWFMGAVWCVVVWCICSGCGRVC